MSLHEEYIPSTNLCFWCVSTGIWYPLVCLCSVDCLAHQKVYLRIRPVSDLILKPPAPSTWPGPHNEELSQYLLSKLIIIQGENCFIHSTIIRGWSLPSRSSMTTWECFIAPYSKILEISGWVLVISVSPPLSINSLHTQCFLNLPT